MNAIPQAYRPRTLGPQQRRWLDQQHPGITRNRVVRTKTHAKDCPHVHDVSAYICSCQENRNAE